MTLIERNASEELIFADNQTAMLFPKGWAQAFPDTMAEEIFDEDGADGSLYGYYSESGDDDNYTCNYQPTRVLQRQLDAGKLREISDEDARQRFPGLIAFLAQQ